MSRFACAALGNGRVVRGALVGEGRRCRVYRGRCDGREAAIKVYSAAAARRCRAAFGVAPAQFECRRNRLFRDAPELARYAAEPFGVLDGEDGEPAFVQAWVEGETLRAHIDRQGLSLALLETGRFIVEAAEKHGLHDLDIPTANVKVVVEDGAPLLKLCDFNMIPQHLSPPNVFLRLQYLLGLRRKSHRDYRSLNDWRNEPVREPVREQGRENVRAS